MDAPDFARREYFEIQATVPEESFKDMIEAAGLKLEQRKVQKETIVIDHLEKMPTEN